MTLSTAFVRKLKKARYLGINSRNDTFTPTICRQRTCEEITPMQNRQAHKSFTGELKCLRPPGKESKAFKSVLRSRQTGKEQGAADHGAARRGGWPRMRNRP
jgi:hypothetical protein